VVDNLARDLARDAGGKALAGAIGGEGEVDGAGRGELLGDGIDPRSAEAWMYPYVSKMNGVKLSFFQKRFNKVYFLLTLLIHSNHSRC